MFNIYSKFFKVTYFIFVDKIDGALAFKTPYKSDSFTFLKISKQKIIIYRPGLYPID